MSLNSTLCNEVEEQVREKMVRYWQVYKPSIESMMLSNDAQYLAENEQNELLSYLPPYRRMNILELGAGIGRFTPRFAQIANHVTAVDFMDAYIKENKETNGHFDNITFVCADATKINYPAESFDMVFSNWLLMYLTDSEGEKLMEKILRWLKPGGYFFFRESCYHQSGNVFRQENPTQYRTPLQYLKMLQRASTEKEKFQLKTLKNILTYIHYHGNPNQLCILTQKKEKEPTAQFHKTIEDMEDHPAGGRLIRLSPLTNLPAGEFMLKDLSTRLALRAGQRVLNTGCGEGSVPAFFVKHCDAYIHAVDDSPVNIHMAIEAQSKINLIHRKKIQYESTNWIQAEFIQEAYEAVLCLDFLLTKRKTIQLIKKAQGWLKAGGKMAILILVKSKNSNILDNEDLLSVEELKDHLNASNLILEDMKPESELSKKHLASILNDLKKSPTDERERKEHEKLVLQITKKTELLQENCIKLVRVIARK